MSTSICSLPGSVLTHGYQHWCRHGFQALSCTACGCWHMSPELLSVSVDKLSHQNAHGPANTCNLRGADRLAATAVRGVRYSGGCAGCHARSAESSGPVKPEGAYQQRTDSSWQWLWHPAGLTPNLTPWHPTLTAPCRECTTVQSSTPSAGQICPRPGNPFSGW